LTQEQKYVTVKEFVDNLNKNPNASYIINEYFNQMMLAVQKVLDSKNQAMAMAFYQKLYAGGEYFNMIRILATCVKDEYKDAVIQLLQNLELVGFLAVGRLKP
jgi:PHD/YefM family antitoxin component YafN of YafNO toxin-antitoxin module